ncbi:hypothetical protein ACTJKE_19690 [Ensifer sp. 22521]|uniref:hypothetical protein n=1 Tax=Ensifer sp. 22521 TaxID=3453935 RepID=UPI003F86AAF8
MAIQSPFPLIARAFQLRIQPSLVAIYAPHSHRPNIVNQVGTGFLVSHNERPVVVTAMHTLYGRSFSEDPGEKSFHWNGQLHFIDGSSRTILQNKVHDIAAFYADELATKPQLSLSSIALPRPLPTFITIGGYLARDFNRHGARLAPAPLIHTDQRLSAAAGTGYVAVRYTKRRNKNSFSSTRIQAAPVPSGLSGGPMVDTLTLFRPFPNVVGVFTDLENGQGYGPDADIVTRLLAGI